MGSTPSKTDTTVGGSSQNNTPSPKGGGVVGARLRSHKEASATIKTSPHQPRPRPPTTSNSPSSPVSPKASRSSHHRMGHGRSTPPTSTDGDSPPLNLNDSSLPQHQQHRPQSQPLEESIISFNGSLPSGGIHGTYSSCPPSISSSATAGNAHIVLPVPRPLDMSNKFSPHHQQRLSSSTSTTTTSKGMPSKHRCNNNNNPHHHHHHISTSSKIHPSPVVIANTPTSAGESCSSCNINSISQSGSGGGCAGQSTSLTHNNSIGGGLGDSSPPTMNEDEGMLSSMIQLREQDDDDDDGDNDGHNSNIIICGSAGGSILQTGIHSISSRGPIVVMHQPSSAPPHQHRNTITAISLLQDPLSSSPPGRRDSVDLLASISTSLTAFQTAAASSLSASEMANSPPHQQHRNSRSGRRCSQVAFVAFTEIPEESGDQQQQVDSGREPSAPAFKVRRRSTANSSSSQDDSSAPQGSGVVGVRGVNKGPSSDGGDGGGVGSYSTNIAAVSSSEMGGSLSAPSIVAPKQRRKSSCKFLMGSASDLGDAVMSEGDDCSSSSASSVDGIHPSRSRGPHPPPACSPHTHTNSVTTGGGVGRGPKRSDDVLLRNTSSTWDFDKEGLDARANVAEVPRSFFPALAASKYSPPSTNTPVVMSPVELFSAPTMGPLHGKKQHQLLLVPSPTIMASSLEQGSPLFPNNHPSSMLALNGTCNPTPGHYFSNSMHATSWSPPMLNFNNTPPKPVSASMPEFHPPSYDDDGGAFHRNNSNSPDTNLNTSISQSSRGPPSSRQVPRIQLLASRHKRRDGGDTSNNASTVSYPLRTNSSSISSMTSTRRGGGGDFVSVLPLASSNNPQQQQLPLPVVSSPLTTPDDYALDVSH